MTSCLEGMSQSNEKICVQINLFITSAFLNVLENAIGGNQSIRKRTTSSTVHTGAVHYSDSAGQGRAEQSRAVQCMAGQGRAGQYSAVQSGTSRNVWVERESLETAWRKCCACILNQYRVYTKSICISLMFLQHCNFYQDTILLGIGETHFLCFKYYITAFRVVGLANKK